MAAHWLVTAADRFAGAGEWLHGPNGPAFFNVALYMGILYGVIGAALLRRPAGAAIGFFGPLAGIALPLAVLSRTARWPTAAEWPHLSRWYYAVIAAFVMSVWGTIFALGTRAAPARRWAGGSAAAGGAFVGYLALAGLLKLAPSIGQWPWSAGPWTPQPGALLDGIFTGLGLAAGIVFARRNHGKSADY